ncbi:unnamed protein product [Effrenium voratum]|uniref:Methyltransferase FkbM domain-containing protein n=1 Tax=Effrenium voratum TaxID=2562239 RepID=A0AA36HQS9_9DINO|nr:unnamed protein product [Effrenium voratum]CAJ1442111.1 unnamed protein product [Effrenium voratum]
MNVSACWSNGLTWETCCRNFLANDCWRPPLTYETCCVLRAESTADARGFILPETPQALLAVQRLEAATGVSARLAWPKGQLLVKWRQSWLCPPPAARQRTSGCEHAAYDNLWAKARTFTELALETAQAAPGDERHAKSFASLLLLAGSVEELHCILRYWHCFEAAHSAFDQVCAIIDLVLLQLASLLGEAPEAFSPWLGQGSFCSQALQRGVNDILQFVLFWVFQRFDQRLRIISQAVRWSDYLARSSGSQEEFGKYMELNPPRGQFYHFSRAVEFNPVCEDLQRYGTRNFYSGFWHRPWLDTTQSLTWHLFIHDIMDIINVRSGGLSRTVLNLGADDGGCNHGGARYWMFDPANCLLLSYHGFGGVFLEGRHDSVEKMRRRFAGRGGALCSEGIATTSNVRVAILRAEPCDGTAPGAEARRVQESLAAGQLDLLKLDVDFGDCDFLEELVPWLRPKLVHAEMNPYYPPPFAQKQHFHENQLMEYIEAGQELPQAVRGCSLSAISRSLGGPEVYVVAQVEFDHVLFIRRDLAAQVLLPKRTSLTLWDHWLAGYYCHPLRRVAREDEWEAGFDFRRFIPTSEGDLTQVEADMHSFLVSAGGTDHLDSEHARWTFSLLRCDECG